MSKWQARIASELRVIGRNPEAADFDNPRGEIVSEVYFILLEDERGNRLRGSIVANEGSKLAAAIQRSLDKGYDPCKSEAFHPMDPAYGSEAYQSQGIEAERAELEKRDAEFYGW
jgi:hypothetical protein